MCLDGELAGGGDDEDGDGRPLRLALLRGFGFGCDEAREGGKTECECLATAVLR